ncbi:MAG: HlyD family efflux transporter periplasmic adaptor subunit, partial [Phycisphaerae bacterium]|nr:HlyD family efflux transporter periplasmic adaptor subunit [Phycisphaerae bacterium]
QRFVMAARDGAVSEQQVQNAQDKARELEAAIGETRAELVGVNAEVLGTPIPNHPVVEKAKSQVRQAYLNFYRRNIVAPMSGYIAKRQVQIGDNVKAGTPLLAIIPLDDLWIEANFLETKIHKVRPGQSVEIKADVYEDEVIYHGKVEGLSPGTGSIFALLPPENATGNFIHIAERIPVRIALDPKELKENPLQPGLSTVTRINITEPGQPLLTSFTTVKGSAYRTTVYDHELDGAELRIQQIINSNMP